ncbi:beta-ketoacyl-ACP synthase II [Methylobacterium brachythecii]|uniref:3-oxoacyl-[acyl-carrier-protein] synthase 2 n=1 Tax=Methylobacterium brachythecii TaxID=1176177 RepID=A0A7W6ARX1_9HYPH|nr:beta-ketoacyl-ACP synthase II [Methylobacterium brachythecii]MBB3904832.1 3-oxoacyl-[acyl-carrier-protein] synthase II [Methylobacterium brachythecii]GLS45384.1 3-oxoacyl-[acyl-carrier-protein] synthase 2 [Methylobacterium brachythecii]
MREPIVVTGMGVASPLGCSVEGMWRRLIASESGLRRLPDDIVPDIDAKVAGLVPSKEEHPDGFDPDALIPVKDRRKMDRFIQFTLSAADQALRQSGWQPSSEHERTRTATVIASGVGGFQTITDAVETVRSRGAPRLSPFTVPAFLVNLAAGHVSIRYGFKGPLGAPVTACAASVQAIGDAMRLIRSGEADVVVCGGAEACVNRVALGGFAAARSLSTAYNDTPEAASRPFDRSRDGFVMGEGAGILVLETLLHAKARGAVPLAELVGYGTSADAYHLTAGPPDGSGARRAITTALAMAGLEPADIGYVNAHATATPVGDAGELAAMRSVFGEACPAISSTKSATGHLLGAAGGLEAIITVQTLREGVLPPTLNLTEPDEAAVGLDLIGPEARRAHVDYALSNGFGFGGVNASIILKRI